MGTRELVDKRDIETQGHTDTETLAHTYRNSIVGR